MKTTNLSAAWAVFLGCNTALRLAAERRISARVASDVLQRAFRAHLIKRDRRGVYSVPKGFPR